MLILTHPNTNRHHGAPVDWNEERDGECATLPTVSTDDLHASFWQPEPHELAILMRGGCIRFLVASTRHPVISVAVEKWPNQLHDSNGNPITGAVHD